MPLLFLSLILFILILLALFIHLLGTKSSDDSTKQNLKRNKIINELNIEEKPKPNELKRNLAIINNALSDDEKFENKLDSYIKKEKAQSEKEKHSTQLNNLNNSDSSDFDDFADALTYGVSKILDFDPIEKLEKIEKGKKDIKNSDFLGSVNFKESNEIYESIHIDKISENSKDFNADLFKKWAKEIFETLQLGSIEDKKIIKEFVLEELFDTILNQEQQLANDNLKYIKEDFTINDIDLFDYSKALNKEEIQVLINATLREYVIDNSSNQILKGNQKLKEKKYVMTFQKRSDTPVVIEKNCPNCGGNISDLDFSRCKYCGSLILPIRYDWTLIKLEII